MAGIAGIAASDRGELVSEMLRKLAHRGRSASKTIEGDGATLGALWSDIEAKPTPPSLQERAVWDAASPPLPTPASLQREREPCRESSQTQP